MKKLFVVLAVALSLGGCGTPLGDAIQFALSTHANPAGPVNIYQAKLVHASALELLDGYRVYCWSKPYDAIIKDPIAKPICQNRRPNVRVMEEAEIEAFGAIKKAEAFILANPRFSAVSVIGEAWAAATAFQKSAGRIAAVIAAK